jgi:hypothetical protein
MAFALRAVTENIIYAVREEEIRPSMLEVPEDLVALVSHAIEIKSSFVEPIRSTRWY